MGKDYSSCVIFGGGHAGRAQCWQFGARHVNAIGCREMAAAAGAAVEPSPKMEPVLCSGKEWRAIGSLVTAAGWAPAFSFAAERSRYCWAPGTLHLPPGYGGSPSSRPLTSIPSAGGPPLAFTSSPPTNFKTVMERGRFAPTSLRS